MNNDFNTQQEIWEYLIAGGKVISTNRNAIFVHFKDSCLVSAEGDRVYASFSFPQDWKKYIEPKWYDNIPQKGVLCWVGNTQKNVESKLGFGHPSFITNYEGDSDEPFEDEGSFCWKYAQPLTKEEVLQFLWEDGND